MKVPFCKALPKRVSQQLVSVTNSFSLNIAQSNLFAKTRQHSIIYVFLLLCSVLSQVAALNCDIDLEAIVCSNDDSQPCIAQCDTGCDSCNFTLANDYFYDFGVIECLEYVPCWLRVSSENYWAMYAVTVNGTLASALIVDTANTGDSLWDYAQFYAPSNGGYFRFETSSRWAVHETKFYAENSGVVDFLFRDRGDAEDLIIHFDVYASTAEELNIQLEEGVVFGHAVSRIECPTTGACVWQSEGQRIYDPSAVSQKYAKLVISPETDLQLFCKANEKSCVGIKVFCNDEEDICQTQYSDETWFCDGQLLCDISIYTLSTTLPTTTPQPVFFRPFTSTSTKQLPTSTTQLPTSTFFSVISSTTLPTTTKLLTATTTSSPKSTTMPPLTSTPLPMTSTTLPTTTTRLTSTTPRITTTTQLPSTTTTTLPTTTKQLTTSTTSLPSTTTTKLLTTTTTELPKASTLRPTTSTPQISTTTPLPTTTRRITSTPTATTTLPTTTQWPTTTPLPTTTTTRLPTVTTPRSTSTKPPQTTTTRIISTTQSQTTTTPLQTTMHLPFSSTTAQNTTMASQTSTRLLSTVPSQTISTPLPSTTPPPNSTAIMLLTSSSSLPTAVSSTTTAPDSDGRHDNDALMYGLIFGGALVFCLSLGYCYYYFQLRNGIVEENGDIETGAKQSDAFVELQCVQQPGDDLKETEKCETKQ